MKACGPLRSFGFGLGFSGAPSSSCVSGLGLGLRVSDLAV